MRMRAFLMLGFALLMAGVVVYLFQDWMQRQIPKAPVIVQKQEPQIETTKVVVAASPLYFGNKIRRESLRLVDWPADSVPPGSFTNFDELLSDDEERSTLRAIEVGEPILASKVSGFGGRAILSAVIAPDMRAVTIRVNDVNGVAGFVLPGDHVDVLLTRSEGGGGNTGMFTDVLLQNVKVLGIDQVASENIEKPKVAKAATLEVTQLQAQKLALAQRVGQLSLALRDLLNVDAELTRTVTISDLRVGEALEPPKVEVAKEVKPKAPKKPVTVKTVKSDPGLSVRIVRALKASEYKVEAERSISSQPAFSKPLNLLPAKSIAPKAEEEEVEQGGATEAGEDSEDGSPTSLTPGAPTT